MTERTRQPELKNKMGSFPSLAIPVADHRRRREGLLTGTPFSERPEDTFDRIAGRALLRAHTSFTQDLPRYRRRQIQPQPLSSFYKLKLAQRIAILSILIFN